MYYQKLLQSENDVYQTITVSGSVHFGYRNLISDFRALLLILAIIPSMKSDCTLFAKAKS